MLPVALRQVDLPTVNDHPRCSRCGGGLLKDGFDHVVVARGAQCVSVQHLTTECVDQRHNYDRSQVKYPITIRAEA